MRFCFYDFCLPMDFEALFCSQGSAEFAFAWMVINNKKELFICLANYEIYVE
jgi:hypothetical protein